jgi:hypothetical protein
MRVTFRKPLQVCLAFCQPCTCTLRVALVAQPLLAVHHAWIVSRQAQARVPVPLDDTVLSQAQGRATDLAMANRDRILAEVARYITVLGIVLPVAYVAPIALFEISSYLGRLDFLAWSSDLALLLSVPWELIATVLIVLRWRDLTQRFWIVYCVNGFLAYLSLPIYRMHFGLY